MTINVYACNGSYLLWSSADWLQLRTKHGIIGAFDGAEGEGWTKLIHVNLPFKLNDYEARYLQSKGVIRIVRIPQLENLKSVTDLNLQTEYVKRFENLQDEELENYKVKKRKEIEQNFDKILEGRRKKGSIEETNCDKEAIIAQELAKSSSFQYESALFDLDDPWVEAKDLEEYIMPELTSELEFLRYRVYQDFHGVHNCFVTSGLKFGGDFIAYTGDPSEYHAEFIIMCEDSKRKFNELYLLSQCRLATTLKKRLVIASYDEPSDTVSYNQVTRPQ